VVEAYSRGLEGYSRRLHDSERPIALLTSTIANQNRDVKKRKMPFSYEDFSFYKPRNAENMPNYVYGSAMIALAASGRLPTWAMFCYKDLASTAKESYKPAIAAFIGEDAILLHPRKVAGGWEGMLIAMESASEKRRTLKNDYGVSITVTIPTINTKVVAIEDVTLS